MSTLTPHHVGFTTLTFHFASLLYTHNEQQPGLQFAAIQHQNSPTSLCVLLCDDEWKILPTGSVADAGSPRCLLSQESHLSSFSICLPRSLLLVPATTSTFCAWPPRFTSNTHTSASLNSHNNLSSTPASKSLASAVMSTTTELGFPHTSIGKCLLAAIAASPAQGHPLALLSLTTYLCVSNHLCLRIKPYSGNCLKLNRKQNKKHQHHIDPTQQLTKQGNKMKEKEQTKKGRIWIGWKNEKENGRRRREKGKEKGWRIGCF
ncbi:hypothetical protein N7455_003717 [Penicillium solitum]|uniref:uncharacterized protein n=1 Tax=Penicillium solitum TaxID=60172 RepID=UPI0032C3EE68|nr:hypothetical protein N7455_003717 [Penicillium solitum]